MSIIIEANVLNSFLIPNNKAQYKSTRSPPGLIRLIKVMAKRQKFLNEKNIFEPVAIFWKNVVCAHNC